MADHYVTIVVRNPDHKDFDIRAVELAIGGEIISVISGEEIKQLKFPEGSTVPSGPYPEGHPLAYVKST